MPKLTNAKGYRDRAMMEVLYATGIKVSELINLDINDIDLRRGYITCRGDEHTRTLQMGRPAIFALKEYIEKARNTLTVSDDVQILFLNMNGTRLSRQGFWKILKNYSKEAGIKKDITPYTLRHSFAIHLLENGADIKFISQMLGYTDIAAMQVYADILDSNMRGEYQKAHPRA
jgi:integrase/recombinase XerD